ncbi:hypothetical protein H7U19_07240 [Hyunsoonleella sp. SJ7]|uniref:Lipocalin-like domain-containing protein n=1 Tax=Hyunsoonleella aquatilis TaxID=2762758 RepID=A0A923H7M9_9FLAO|nr:hypothetical protein [Hyunsoonleella aquatilis]MBC3758191.1 hypothetical protein [Hyunsoonleella aquatilis]
MACSSGDDSSPEEETHPREAYFLEAIIGSWAYDTIKLDGQLFLYQHTEGCVKDRFQFYNREGKEFDFEESVVLNCSNCAECASRGTGLEWALNGDKISLYWRDQVVLIYKIIDVDDEKFTYEVEVDYDEDGDIDLLEITGIPYDPYGEFD